MVDLLIKDLDEYALKDIMDVIHQYGLTYSLNRNESTAENNDFRFQDMMKQIVQHNTVLHESMQPLVNNYMEHIEAYELNGSLLEKCEAMTFIK
jgi:hypothetical protein